MQSCILLLQGISTQNGLSVAYRGDHRSDSLKERRGEFYVKGIQNDSNLCLSFDRLLNISFWSEKTSHDLIAFFCKCSRFDNNIMLYKWQALTYFRQIHPSKMFCQALPSFAIPRSIFYTLVIIIPLFYSLYILWLPLLL